MTVYPMSSACSRVSLYLLRAAWRPSYTSTSIRASAFSASGADDERTRLASARPARMFCARQRGSLPPCIRLTSAENESRGYASTALMVRVLLPWTVAKPAETASQLSPREGGSGSAGLLELPACAKLSCPAHCVAAWCAPLLRQARLLWYTPSTIWIQQIRHSPYVP